MTNMMSKGAIRKIVTRSAHPTHEGWILETLECGHRTPAYSKLASMARTSRRCEKCVDEANKKAGLK